MERRQDVSVVCLYDVLLERHNDVSKGRNNDAPPLRLHDVSNETPNNVLTERRQDVLVVRFHNVLLERHNDVSKRRNSDSPSLRLHDVSSKS